MRRLSGYENVTYKKHSLEQSHQTCNVEIKLCCGVRLNLVAVSLRHASCLRPARVVLLDTPKQTLGVAYTRSIKRGQEGSNREALTKSRSVSANRAGNL